MYKMAALDIDGTIAVGGVISHKTRKVIKQLEADGVHVCLCTGRNVANTSFIVDDLGLSTPYVCCDGMLMAEPKTDKLLYANLLEKDVFLKCLDIVRAEDFYIEIVTDGKYYKHALTEAAKAYDYALKGLAPGSVEHIDCLKRIYTTNEALCQIIIGGKPELHAAVRDSLLDVHDSVEIKDTLWPGYGFINSKDINKFRGVQRLCEYYGISTDEVVAIGDELNDLEMLEGCGMGVAMGNAQDRVRQSADFVTESVENDGAALALLKFFG